MGKLVRMVRVLLTIVSRALVSHAVLSHTPLVSLVWVAVGRATTVSTATSMATMSSIFIKIILHDTILVLGKAINTITLEHSCFLAILIIVIFITIITVVLHLLELTVSSCIMHHWLLLVRGLRETVAKDIRLRSAILEWLRVVIRHLGCLMVLLGLVGLMRHLVSKNRLSIGIKSLMTLRIHWLSINIILLLLGLRLLLLLLVSLLAFLLLLLGYLHGRLC